MKLEDARDYWRRRGVPEDAIEDLWSLSQAARDNDDDCDSGREDLLTLLHKWGWHPEAIRYLAQQRALRCIMVATPEGRKQLQELARKFEPATLAGMPEEALLPLQMAWIDGFANAARYYYDRENADAAT